MTFGRVTFHVDARSVGMYRLMTNEHGDVRAAETLIKIVMVIQLHATSYDCIV